MGYNCSFRFKIVNSTPKKQIMEVLSVYSNTKFYHIVENGRKGYPESNWPETIFNKDEAITKFNNHEITNQ
jgi:hypothetical protein